jgi:hypothetical protein
MLEGFWEENVDMKFGSHFLNALWLRLFSEPFLLWGRVGYALVKATMGLFTFLLLRRTFPSYRPLVFGSAFWGMLAVSIYGGQVMNYNNLPVFLMLGALLIFSKAVEEGCSKRGLWLFLGASLIPVAVLCRFPFLVFCFLTLIWGWMRFVHHPLEPGHAGVRMGQMLSGMLFGFLCVTLLLLGVGVLEDYVRMIDHKLIEGFFYGKGESVRVEAHQKDELLRNYGQDLLTLLKLTVPLGLVFLLVEYLYRRFREWEGILLPIFGLFVLALLWTITRLEPWHYGMVALPLAMLLFYGAVRKWSFPSSFMLYWGSLLFGISFLGSNNGIFNILITGGGILLFAYALFLLWSLSRTVRRTRFSASPILLACILFVPFFLLRTKPHEIYRDGPRKGLNTMMGDPSLFGIFSRPDRVEKVDGILRASEKWITPYKDGLLIGNQAPMFYFLTEAPYTLTKDWKMLGKSREEKTALLKGRKGPEFILMMHRDPRIWDWPDADRPCVEGDRAYYDFYVDFLKGGAYEKVFDNGCFSLHRKRTEP